MSAAPEFSRPVPVGDLQDEPRTYALAAGEAECASLAKRFGLLGLSHLTARVEARRLASGDVLASGTLTARVSQACVVTLVPVASEVETSFRRRYVAGEADQDLAVDDEDRDPLVGEAVDIGELVAQEFGLALDPYTRAPGAMAETGPVAAGRESPFAVLRQRRS